MVYRLRSRNTQNQDEVIDVATGTSIPVALVPRAARATRTVTNMRASGYFYPLAPSGRKLKRCRVVILEELSHIAPVPHVDEVFVNPNGAITTSTTIIQGKRKYLVVGYYDTSLDANMNLQALSPGLVWRGEVAVFSLGTRIRIKARPVGTQYEMEAAIRHFVEGCTNAQVIGVHPPRQLVSQNGVYDTGI